MRLSTKQAFAQTACKSLVPVDFRDFLEKEVQQHDAALSRDGLVSVRDVHASPKSRRQ